MATHGFPDQIADARHPRGKTALKTALAARGIALFSGVPEAASLVDLARTMGTVVDHRDSDGNGVTTIAACAKSAENSSGFAGFTYDALPAHTDRSGIAKPPHLLFVTCARTGTAGGACVTVDARAVYDDLAREHPKGLAALRTPRTVLFGGAAGHLGAVFTSLADDRLAIRLRLDDLATFSPLVVRHLPALRDLIDRHSIIFTLEPGQGYVLDNYRWLHGRHAFTGDRILYRVHANPPTTRALPRGFRPLHDRANSAA